MADIVDFTSIVIAVVAIIISLIVFYSSRKREEFRIASDIIIKLERLYNEMLNTEILRKERTENPEASSQVTKKNTPPWRYDKKKEIPPWNPDWSKILQFHDHLDFMSLLIDNKEITNKSIIHHFTELIEGQLVILRNYQGDASLGVRERLEFLKNVWSKKPGWVVGRMENLKIRFLKIFQGKSK